MEKQPLPDTKVNRLIQWNRGKTPGPWELIVFPTNRCNQRCKICWQRFVEKEHGRVETDTELSDERLLKLVDESAELGVREWSIVGGGEPMIRADLVMEMCQRIRALGMNGSLHSNGTRFTHDQLETLVRIGWERVTVSLDGPDPEINDNIRSKDCFTRATEALRTIKELRHQYNTCYPLTTTNSVVTRTNYDKLDQMVELGHELELHFVGASVLIVQGDLCATFELSLEQRAELPQHVKRAKALADKYGIKNDFDYLIPAAVVRKEQTTDPDAFHLVGDGRLSDALCFEPWLTMAILAESGKAGPCTVFWEPEVLNLTNHTLKEAWLGNYMQKLRHRIANRENIPSYCNLCCSHIITRTELMRAEATPHLRQSLSQLGPIGAIQHISKSLLFQLQKNGIKKTARRAYEWVRTQKTQS